MVNSTDPSLQHTKGQVSTVLLMKAGAGLTQQCQERYPRGIGDHAVAVTDTFGLKQFKYIFHVVLPQITWDPNVSLLDRPTV